MLTLDTSGLVAIVSSGDTHHRASVAALDADSGPYVIPTAVLAEISYVLESRVGPRLVIEFLLNVENGAFTLHGSEQDIPRIRQLLEKYADLGLDLSDAAVVACAEHYAGRVLTTDLRHFAVVARGEGSLTILPEDGMGS